MTNRMRFDEDESYGLVVKQEGKVQQTMFKYVVLTLNYQYAQQIVLAEDLKEAAGLLRGHGTTVRSVFIIQNEKITNKMFVYALSLQGKIPVFILCPLAMESSLKILCKGLENVFVCSWERSFQNAPDSLRIVIGKNLKGSLEELINNEEEIPYEELQKRVEIRVKGLQTLPAIPEIVLRIMRMVNDPNANIEALEQLLLNDPAIVQKLLQVVSAPSFAGAAKTGNWNLKEAIVRLGLKKAGAIAQQVKMMNTFIKPEDSSFDLRRFWEHSIGCAMCFEKICNDKLVPLKEEIPFDTYWISSILHDIGKMILGFFFWDHFQNVVTQMAEGRDDLASFREAEVGIGEAAHHERVGQMLLMKSNVRKELVEAVSSHHTVTESSTVLTALLYLVNNLTKDLGLGYLPDEKGVYTDELLAKLELKMEDVDKIRETFTETLVPEIKNVVELCLG